METDNEWFIERANHKLKQYLEINGIQYLEIDKIYKNSNGLYNNENKEILSTIFLPFTNLIKNHRYGFGVGIHKNTFDNLYFLCKKNNVEDIFIIEDSKEFDGRYFVIDELEIDLIIKLQEYIKNSGVKNILFAITPSIANDAFILYIEDKLKDFDISFTKIAQGVPTGVSLENVDLMSLSKAIQSQVGI